MASPVPGLPARRFQRLILSHGTTLCNAVSHSVQHFREVVPGRKRDPILNRLHALSAALALVPNPVTPPSAPKPVFAAIVANWHDDLVLMVRDRLPKVAAVLLMLFIIQRIVRFAVGRLERASNHPSILLARGTQLRTMATLIRGTLYSVLGFVAFIQFLRLFNYDPTPLLASAGILGVGIGLGAQSLCKDIINGVFIFIEDQYNVGETVKVATLTGTVEDLTLRLTRLRDADGTLYIIPNSQIATVQNLSRDFAVATLSISVDASADIHRVLEILHRVAQDLRLEPTLKDAMMSDPGVSGIDSINGRALTYSVAAKVRIDRKDDLLRAFRNRIVETFKAEGIPLGIDPANMLVLQQQKLADPTAPPAQHPLPSA